MRKGFQSFGVPSSLTLKGFSARGVGGMREDLARQTSEGNEGGMFAKIYNSSPLKSMSSADPRYDTKADAVENIYWPAAQSQEIKKQEDFLAKLGSIFSLK